MLRTTSWILLLSLRCNGGLYSPMSFVKNSKAWSTDVAYVGRMQRTAWQRYRLKHPGLHSTEPNTWFETWERKYQGSRIKDGDTNTESNEQNFTSVRSVGSVSRRQGGVDGHTVPPLRAFCHQHSYTLCLDEASGRKAATTNAHASRQPAHCVALAAANGLLGDLYQGEPIGTGNSVPLIVCPLNSVPLIVCPLNSVPLIVCPLNSVPLIVCPLNSGQTV